MLPNLRWTCTGSRVDTRSTDNRCFELTELAGRARRFLLLAGHPEDDRRPEEEDGSRHCGRWQSDCAETRELAEVGRAFLEASVVAVSDASAATAGRHARGHCGEASLLPAEAAAACARVRELIFLRPISRVFREFVGGLLYLVIARSPREEDMHTWTDRFRLIELLHAVCSAGCVPATGDRKPCPECSCRHIAIQEALSLVRYIRELGAPRETPSGAGGAAKGCRLAPLLEDGLWHLLGAIQDLAAALHPPCYAAVHIGEAGDGAVASGMAAASWLAWRDLYLEVAAPWRGPPTLEAGRPQPPRPPPEEEEDEGASATSAAALISAPLVSHALLRLLLPTATSGGARRGVGVVGQLDRKANALAAASAPSTAPVRVPREVLVSPTSGGPATTAGAAARRYDGFAAFPPALTLPSPDVSLGV